MPRTFISATRKSRGSSQVLEPSKVLSPQVFFKEETKVNSKQEKDTPVDVPASELVSPAVISPLIFPSSPSVTPDVPFSLKDLANSCTSTSFASSTSDSSSTPLYFSSSSTPPFAAPLNHFASASTSSSFSSTTLSSVWSSTSLPPFKPSFAPPVSASPSTSWSFSSSSSQSSQPSVSSEPLRKLSKSQLIDALSLAPVSEVVTDFQCAYSSKKFESSSEHAVAVWDQTLTKLIFSLSGARRTYCEADLSLALTQLYLVPCLLALPKLCDVVGCMKPIGEVHCGTHTCSVEGCSAQKSDQNLYCKAHNCAKEGCLHQKLLNRHFCSTHVCRNESCNNVSLYGGLSFCLEHSEQTTLHLAVISGELSAVQNALEQGTTDIDKKTTTGQTSLHLASSKDDIPIIDALLTKKASVGSLDNLGNTPLHIAAKHSASRALNKLLNCGATTTSINTAGFSPLLVAVVSGSLECLRSLLSHKASAEAKDADGNTALHLACRHHETSDMLLHLLNLSLPTETSNFDGETCLHIAVTHERKPLVLLLINRGADVNKRGPKGRSALALAASCGNLDIVNLLLFRKADINAVDDEKRYVAAWAAKIPKSNQWNNECLALLMQRGACIDDVLCSALDANNMPCVEFLVGQNNVKITPENLVSATKSRNSLSFKLLVEKNTDAISERVVKLLLETGQVDELRLYLSSRAHVQGDATQHISRDAVHHALTAEMLSFLISRGANVNARNSEDSTALHMLVTQESSLPNVTVLLENGAHPNSTDRDGFTPLGTLAQSFLSPSFRTQSIPFRFSSPFGISSKVSNTFAIEMCKLLLKYGADLNCRDNSGTTAHELFTRSSNGRQILVQLAESTPEKKLEQDADLTLTRVGTVPLLGPCLPAFSSNLVAFSSADDFIYVISVRDWTVVMKIPNLEAFRVFEFSPNGLQLYGASKKSFAVWSIASSTLEITKLLPKNIDPVLFSADCKLCVGRGEGCIDVWSFETASIIRSFAIGLDPRAFPYNNVPDGSVCFSSDGKLLAYFASNIRCVWSIDGVCLFTETPTVFWPYRHRHSSFSVDGHICAGDDVMIYIDEKEQRSVVGSTSASFLLSRPSKMSKFLANGRLFIQNDEKIAVFSGGFSDLRLLSSQVLPLATLKCKNLNLHVSSDGLIFCEGSEAVFALGSMNVRMHF